MYSDEVLEMVWVLREGGGPALLDWGLSVAPLSPASMLPGHSNEGVIEGVRLR